MPAGVRPAAESRMARRAVPGALFSVMVMEVFAGNERKVIRHMKCLVFKMVSYIA